jgi:hypothetical protein
MYVFNCRQKEKYLSAMMAIQPHASGEMFDALKKLLESYEKELFPYQEKEEWNQKESISSIMQRQMEKGPMMVESMSHILPKRK